MEVTFIFPADLFIDSVMISWPCHNNNFLSINCTSLSLFSLFLGLFFLSFCLSLSVPLYLSLLFITFPCSFFSSSLYRPLSLTISLSFYLFLAFSLFLSLYFIFSFSFSIIIFTFFKFKDSQCLFEVISLKIQLSPLFFYQNNSPSMCVYIFLWQFTLFNSFTFFLSLFLLLSFSTALYKGLKPVGIFPQQIIYFPYFFSLYLSMHLI